MKCPICQTELQGGKCPSCGYYSASMPAPDFCEEETGFNGVRGNNFVRGRGAGTKWASRLVVLVLIILGSFAAVVILLPWEFSSTPGTRTESAVVEPGPDKTPEKTPALPNALSGELPDLSESRLEVSQLSPTVLYEGEGLTVQAVSFSYESDAYTAGNCGVFRLDLYLTNTSDTYYELDFTTFSANGVALGGNLWCGIAPGDWYATSLELDAEQLLRSGITYVNSVSCNLTISDGDTGDALTQVPVTANGDEQRAWAPQAPDSVPVYDENGISLYYVGGSSAYNYDGLLQPTFWFYMENNTDETCTLFVSAVQVDEESENYPMMQGGEMAAGFAGWVGICPSADLLQSQGTVADYSRLQIQFSVTDEDWDYLADEESVEITLAGRADTL